MKPNKQKTDWDKDFDKIIVDWEEIPISERLKIKGGYYGLMKDFIAKTLQQQREDFKQTMANSNEWWNNKLRQQREEIIKEIEGILKHGCESCMGDLHEGCKCDFERIKLFRELLQSLKK